MNYNEVAPASLKRKKGKKTPQAKAKTKEPSGWPQSLQNFVDLSFLRSQSLNDADKATFSTQIQHLMELAISQKKIWTNPWELQSLPIFDRNVVLDLYQNVAPIPKPIQKRLNAEFDSKERKKQRMARFGESSPAPPSPSQKNKNGIIIGTLTDLEKRYLRLTSEPDPTKVRPQRVLEKCVPFVVGKYKNEKALYLYVNDQLKAIRQDLTVQHIKNDFSIHVYETHGRLAIENDDLGEFNQCQSQLKHLYADKLREEATFYESTYEYTCYRVLYLLLTGNHSEINRIKLELLESDTAHTTTPQHKEHRICVYEALNLLTYVTQGNYHEFFKVYKKFLERTSMTLGYHLLKKFMVSKQRLVAINTMCKAYRILPAEFLENELGFGKEDNLADFAKDHQLASFLGKDFDCAAARATLQTIVDKGNFKKVDIKGQV